MSNIIGIVEAAISDANHGDEGSAAIKAFLQAAEEKGWHMRPDEATGNMEWCMGQTSEPMGKMYRAMLAAAPPFEWDE